MANAILWFWLFSVIAGVVALVLLRTWPFLALFVLPLSVAFPLALSSTFGSRGSSYSVVGTVDAVGACLLVAALNLLGMKLGKYKFVFFPPYPGRGPSGSDVDPHERS